MATFVVVLGEHGLRLPVPGLKESYTKKEAEEILPYLGYHAASWWKVDWVGFDYYITIAKHVIETSGIDKSKVIGQHLYFMQNEKGWIKIGRSNNPELRKYDLEFETGFKIEILAVVRKQGHAEIELHKRYKSQRVTFYNALNQKCREWFEPSAELLTEITKITNG